MNGTNGKFILRKSDAQQYCRRPVLKTMYSQIPVSLISELYKERKLAITGRSEYNLTASREEKWQLNNH